jgi:adenylate kinase
MKNIILIAPPGAGKGTAAKELVDNLNMVHISVGDLLREEVKSGSELGKSLSAIMQSGKLVEDELIFEIMRKRFSEPDVQNGIILDGFPRNTAQAIELDKMDTKIDAVIYMNVSREVLEDRIVGRIVCPECGRGYNTNNKEMMPKVENTCDKCGATLIKRKDDTKEVFDSRYNTYLEETEPVLEYYRNKGNLYNIDSTNKDETYNRILEILEA